MSTLINWGTLQKHLPSEVTKALQNSFDDMEKKLKALEAKIPAETVATNVTNETVNNITQIQGSLSYAGVTVAMAAGTTINFPQAFQSVLDPTKGDYAVSAIGKDGSGNLVPVRYTRTPSSLTLLPDFDSTTVEWTATGRTQ